MDNERKRSPDELYNEENLQDIAFYRFILDSLPVGVLTVNPEMKITSFNPWAQSLTGYIEDEALGSYCGDILQGGMCTLNCPLRRAIVERRPMVRMETTIQKKNGEKLPVRMHTAALLDREGALVGAVEAFQDVSALKAMERERENIISMFAHDMKSSLTIIGGFVLRLIKRTTGIDQEKQSKYLEIIQKETEKLDFIVHDFLEFSRLQRGELQLDLQPMSPDKELTELFEAYQAKASQSDIKLEFENENIQPIILADPNRLRRVFTNLLDNAFKFSSRGGKVVLSSEETEGDVIVTIRDQGLGIDPEDLPFIFDIFHRGKGVGQKEGAGIGLAAVKSIVEGHGGNVSVSSEPGKGSSFIVSLPKLDTKKKNQVTFLT